MYVWMTTLCLLDTIIVDCVPLAHCIEPFTVGDPIKIEKLLVYFQVE